MAERPDWPFSQSAVIPYQIDDGQIKIMLITSRKRKRWVIPKGVIERPLTPAESAVKEAWEEAGITGQINSASIGTYKYQKWGGTCQVRVYLFEVEQVLNAWPEDNLRSREWVSAEEAARRVDEAQLKEMIQALPTRLLQDQKKN